MDVSHSLWPPPYFIKKHRRARYVKLRVMDGGLNITVPYRFNVADLPAILDEHKAWIQKQLVDKPRSLSVALPEQIEFGAIGATWRVFYEPCQKTLELICRPQQELVVVGHIEAKVACQFILAKWVRQQAGLYLPNQLDAMSAMTGLRYQQLILRNQKTLWGSCTGKRSISLNYKLIFLPKSLADHVMIHELCHTKHMNHSKRFWDLVASHDPDWQENRRLLRKADQYIPKWL